jgi:hypothetical protein
MKYFKSYEKPDVLYLHAIKKPIPQECWELDEACQVETLEGTMKGKKGDWLMVGIDGELYVCEKSIFERTYQLLDLMI